MDMSGTALDNGGGYIMYGSNGYVYAPGGQGILTGESSEMGVLITAIARLRHEPVGASLLSLMLADTITQ